MDNPPDHNPPPTAACSTGDLAKTPEDQLQRPFAVLRAQLLRLHRPFVGDSFPPDCQPTGEPDDDLDTSHPLDIRPYKARLADPDHPAENYGQMVSRAFGKAFKRRQITLDDLTPDRIKVSWRLVVFLTRLHGLIDDSTALAAGMQPIGATSDPWHDPLVYKPAYGYGAIAVRHLLQSFPETTILPPRIPRKFITPNGGITSDYDPIKDTGLCNYCKLLGAAADALGIQYGSPIDPECGERGIAGLLDPFTVRVAFPSKADLCTVETAFVEQAVELMGQNSIAKTLEEMKRIHGFKNYELARIIQLARLSIAEQYETDLDVGRHVMVHRLQTLADRAKDALDIRAELAAMKAEAVILGLVRTETGDSATEFVKAVRAITNDNGAIELAPIPDELERLLPPSPSGIRAG